jgi:hypothetical protein
MGGNRAGVDMVCEDGVTSKPIGGRGDWYLKEREWLGWIIVAMVVRRTMQTCNCPHSPRFSSSSHRPSHLREASKSESRFRVSILRGALCLCQSRLSGPFPRKGKGTVFPSIIRQDRVSARVKPFVGADSFTVCGGSEQVPSHRKYNQP